MQTLVTHHDLDVGFDEVDQHRTVLLTLHRDALHVELLGDSGEFAQLFAAGNRDEFETISLTTQHVERLHADGSGRTEQRHASARGRHR